MSFRKTIRSLKRIDRRPHYRASLAVIESIMATLPHELCQASNPKRLSSGNISAFQPTREACYLTFPNCLTARMRATLHLRYNNICFSNHSSISQSKTYPNNQSAIAIVARTPRRHQRNDQEFYLRQSISNHDQIGHPSYRASNHTLSIASHQPRFDNCLSIANRYCLGLHARRTGAVSRRV